MTSTVRPPAGTPLPCGHATLANTALSMNNVRANLSALTAAVLPENPSVTLTDMNDDGRSDLLYRNASSGQVYRIFMNGLAPGAGAMIYNEPNLA